VELVDERTRVVGGRRGTELDTDRVTHPGEEVDVRAVDLTRALTDPHEVRRAVVRQTRARVDAREGPLVVEQERLVAREELDRLERVEVRAARGHEADRAVDLRRGALVARVGGVVREEAPVP